MMERRALIEMLAAPVIKYAKEFGICVASPIIAQGVLESGDCTSRKTQVHNYFGLKYRANRLDCHCGFIEDGGSEQNADGSIVQLPSTTAWYAFDSVDSGVKGYFQFINIANYANLKGVTDPFEYCRLIREDNYATDLEYVSKLTRIIDQYELQKYDSELRGEEKMSIQIVEKICTNNPCYKSGQKINYIGEMLHSVGCPQPDPLVFVKIWDKSDANVAVHAVVGKDPVVYLCLPYGWRGWHCASGSKGSGNNTLWSMEMTEPATIKYTSGSNWIETGNGANTKAHVLATYKNAVEMFAYMAKKYGFNPLDSNVIMSHSEGNKKGIASNHGDVEHIWRHFGLSMDQFRKDVQTAIAGGVVDTVPDKPVDNSSDDTSKQAVKDMHGTVTIVYDGDDGINIRKAPSILADIDHVVGKGEVFTVTGISADEKWYRLKSGLYVTTIPSYVSFKATEEQKESTAGTGYYRVRTDWGKADSQIGAFKDKNNAIELCKQNIGYKVFDNDGKEIYPLNDAVESFLFRVKIDDLRIRKGPGTGYDYHKKNGKPLYTGKGQFTIVKTRDGQGAKLWGLLKAYAADEDGWIALDEAYGDRL